MIYFEEWYEGVERDIDALEAEAEEADIPIPDDEVEVSLFDEEPSEYVDDMPPDIEPTKNEHKITNNKVVND